MGVAGMSRPRFRAYPIKAPWTEAGAALLAFLLVLLVGGSYAFLGDAKSFAQRAKLEEPRKTSKALAEAKAALIGYAVSREIDPNCTAPGDNCSRPGDLPCPDLTSDGGAENVPICGTHDGQGEGGQSRQLGRLPWKDLRLPDLRDGAGERLWYAVSTNFKVNARSRCTTPSNAGCLNSDSSGTITVKNQDGSYRHDGRNDADGYTKSGAVAVVIAAGPPLRRVGYGEQDRTCTSTCDPRDFLEVGNGEDNANFEDSDTDGDGDGDGSPDGFIQGDVLDSNGTIILNDRLLPITYRDLVPLLEKRVVGEALSCLRAYAGAHGGRVPWAASVEDVSCPPPPPDAADNCYSDDYSPGLGREPDRFGRLADRPFNQTSNDASDMSNSWLSGCLLRQTSGISARWWRNWKELVFYGLADGYRPQPLPLPTDPPGPCADPPDACLTVNSQPSQQVVVIASGKRLPAIAEVPDALTPPQPPPPAPYDQDRSTSSQKTAIRNYLEGENATPDGPLPPPPPPLPPYRSFVSGPATGTFNDFVGYLPRP